MHSDTHTAEMTLNGEHQDSPHPSEGLELAGTVEKLEEGTATRETSISISTAGAATSSPTPATTTSDSDTSDDAPQDLIATAAALHHSPLERRRRRRIVSIDVLRGFVVVLMANDHVRERFFYHKEVSDPMDLGSTSPALFFTRLTSHLCAPTFVFLGGLSAWLHAHPAHASYRPVSITAPALAPSLPPSPPLSLSALPPSSSSVVAPASSSPTSPPPPKLSLSRFLWKRGLFLVATEVLLVNFSWFGNFDTIYLQVIWAIGISMIALSLAVRLGLPRALVGAMGLLIVGGHNLLSSVSLSAGERGYTAWAILLGRGVIYENASFRVKASYPVLPWIGVIFLGYVAGPMLYASTTYAQTRRRRLAGIGAGGLVLLLVLRGTNVYGEVLPWRARGSALLTAMDFVNYTKYPPSLDFLLLTVPTSLLLLAWFETLGHCSDAPHRLVEVLAVFGSAPLFFYILHLYTLLICYRIALATAGPNAGELFAFEHVWQIWAAALVVVLALYFPVKKFAEFKHNTDRKWVKYF